MRNFLQTLGRHLIHWWRRQIGTALLPLLTTVRVAGLVLAAIAMWIFAQIAERVVQDETHGFDVGVLFAIQQLQQPWLTPIMVGITTIGDPTVLIVACVGLSFWSYVYRKRRSEAVTIVIAAIGALVLNTWLKSLFERARPALWSRTVDVRYYSFPSGHAMLSMVILGLLGYLLSVHLPRHRTGITIATIALIVLIGFSRLYLGVHWLTDVIAGYAAGFVWLSACILSLEIWKQRSELGAGEDDR